MASLLSNRERRIFGFSPWLLGGVSLILGLAVVFFVFRDSERGRMRMGRMLFEKASTLVWTLEAGVKTWIGHENDRESIQLLVDEAARQPGIAYLAVLDSDGQFLAHSDHGKVGAFADRQTLPNLSLSNPMEWRVSNDDSSPVFEVYRLFAPIHDSEIGHHGQGMGRRFMRGLSGSEMTPSGLVRPEDQVRVEAIPNILVVALDERPFRNTYRADSRNTLLSAALVAALGLGGFISLFWAHNYRRSRRMLLDVQAMSSEVIGSLPMGLITCDAQGRVDIVNQTAAKMLGRSAAELTGTMLADTPALDWGPVFAELEDGGRVLEEEMELVAPDSRTIPVRLSASSIRDEEGGLLGYVFIVGDIDEVKRLRREVRRNERLTELGTLAAGVAHEIRNPLSTIKGLAIYMAKRMPEGEREREAAATMVQEVSRLNEVVSELLEFARPTVAKGESSNVNEVIRRALRLADADVKAKNISVGFSADESLPSVKLNAERFTQALLNLILNAVQAMGDGGSLGVETSVDAARRRLGVTVSDNGKGMTEQVRKAVFNPYFTTKPSGTGLGLAIVHQIVEAHDGDIAVKSSPGEGSAFTIYLPLDTERG